MPLFSRFGKAINELGSHLKASPVAAAYRKGGFGAAGRTFMADLGEPYANAALKGAPDIVGGVVPVKEQIKAGLRAFGPEIIGGAGGTAAGYGYGRYQRSRGRHVSSARMGAYMLAGGKLGSTVGMGYTFHRHAGVNNTFRHLARAPGAAWRGFRA